MAFQGTGNKYIVSHGLIYKRINREAVPYHSPLCINVEVHACVKLWRKERESLGTRLGIVFGGCTFIENLKQEQVPSNIVCSCCRYCKLHLLRAGSYAIQSTVIAFVINTLLSTPTFCPAVSLLSLPLPFLCSLLISILVACATYPHYIYSDKSTTLFLINVGYDVVQVTSGTLAIYSLSLAFN